MENSQGHNGGATVPAIPEILLTEIEGEPRARDIDIAKRLGFAVGGERQIRRLIQRNRAELESYGPLACHRDTSISGKGRQIEVDEFCLNEEQALTIAAISKAPKAPAVRSMLIRTFVAWRRGHLVGSNDDQVAKLEAKLAHFENMLTAFAINNDPRRAALEYASVCELLNEAGAFPKGRNSLNRRVGYDLKLRSLKTVANDDPSPVRRAAHTGTWLYRREFAERYMRERGASLVADHNAKVTGGQGVIAFADRRKFKAPGSQPAA
jgi:hypothetical protein